MESQLPDDLRRFVLTSVPSVPYLEALLQFHRAPQTERSAASLSAEIYVSESTAAALIRQLESSGIVSAVAGRAGLYAYAPMNPGLADLIGRLARAYSGDLIGVTHLIHDATQRSAIRFADAFKFRKGR